MPKVTTLTSERELFIMINDLPHLRIDRRELIGIQSWTQNRGRGEPMYQIEFYTKSGPTIIADYDDKALWADILAKLAPLNILEEWK